MMKPIFCYSEELIALNIKDSKNNNILFGYYLVLSKVYAIYIIPRISGLYSVFGCNWKITMLCTRGSCSVISCILFQIERASKFVPHRLFTLK